jgi:hypothetical protein
MHAGSIPSSRRSWFVRLGQGLASFWCRPNHGAGVITVYDVQYWDSGAAPGGDSGSGCFPGTTTDSNRLRAIYVLARQTYRLVTEEGNGGSKEQRMELIRTS